MATLAESFLADLEDLSDDEPVAEEGLEDAGGQAEAMDEDKDGAVGPARYDDLRSVAKLQGTAQYAGVMARVTAALEEADQQQQQQQQPDQQQQPSTSAPAAAPAPAAPAPAQAAQLLEDDPTYRLLVDCNRLAADIDAEVAAVHAFLRDRYRARFPELESLVHSAVDYARVVERIGDAADIAAVELDDLLPAAATMVVAVTATTTAGRPLAPDALARALEACAAILALDADRAKIIRFVEGRMGAIAPNLSAVAGPEVAARLMGLAGGLAALARVPACNVLVLGAKRRHLAGLSSTAAQPHQGVVYQSPVVQGAPPPLRIKTAKLVASKAALLARVDAYGEDPSGATGARLLAEVRAKLERWQEPPPAKQIKPLAAPDAEVKKRRGGRRLRKMKERYGLTDMRKAAGRTKFDFAQAEEEYVDGDEIVSLGALGTREGSGALRVVATASKVKLNAKQQKKYKGRLAPGLASAAVNGLSSSLAFTPVQGIELADPVAAAAAARAAGGGNDPSARGGAESYFSERAGFRSLLGGAGGPSAPSAHSTAPKK